MDSTVRSYMHVHFLNVDALWFLNLFYTEACDLSQLTLKLNFFFYFKSCVLLFLQDSSVFSVSWWVCCSPSNLDSTGFRCLTTIVPLCHCCLLVFVNLLVWITSIQLRGKISVTTKKRPNASGYQTIIRPRAFPVTEYGQRNY